MVAEKRRPVAAPGEMEKLVIPADKIKAISDKGILEIFIEEEQ